MKTGAALKKFVGERRHGVYTQGTETTTVTHYFAVVIANERYAVRKRRQKITYDPTNFNWKVQDTE